MQNVARCNLSTFAALGAFHRQTRKRQGRSQTAKGGLRALVQPLNFSEVGGTLQSRRKAGFLGARRNGRNPLHGGTLRPQQGNPTGFPCLFPPWGASAGSLPPPTKAGGATEGQTAAKGNCPWTLSDCTATKGKKQGRSPSARETLAFFLFVVVRGTRGTAAPRDAGRPQKTATPFYCIGTRSPFVKRGFPSIAASWRLVEKRGRHSLPFRSNSVSVIAEKKRENKAPPKKGGCAFSPTRKIGGGRRFYYWQAGAVP